MSVSISVRSARASNSASSSRHSVPPRTKRPMLWTDTPEHSASSASDMARASASCLRRPGELDSDFNMISAYFAPKRPSGDSEIVLIEHFGFPPAVFRSERPPRNQTKNKAFHAAPVPLADRDTLARLLQYSPCCPSRLSNWSVFKE